MAVPPAPPFYPFPPVPRVLGSFVVRAGTVLFPPSGGAINKNNENKMPSSAVATTTRWQLTIRFSAAQHRVSPSSRARMENNISTFYIKPLVPMCLYRIYFVRAFIISRSARRYAAAAACRGRVRAPRSMDTAGRLCRRRRSCASRVVIRVCSGRRL